VCVGGGGGVTFLSGEKTWYSEYSLCKTNGHLSTRDMPFPTAPLAHIIWDSCFPTNSYTFKQAMTAAAYSSLLCVSLQFLRKSQVTSSALYRDPVQFGTKYTAEIALGRFI